MGTCWNWGGEGRLEKFQRLRPIKIKRLDSFDKNPINVLSIFAKCNLVLLEEFNHG